MRTNLAFTIAAALTAKVYGQTAGDFHFKNAATVQEFQELANLVRTVADIPGITTDNDGRLLHVRGTAEQVGLAGWLVKQLDQPLGSVAGSAVLEYKLGANDVARIVYMPHTATVQDFQEAATAVRTISAVRRAFTYNDGRAFVFRDTQESVAVAAWMAAELDASSDPQASQRSGVREYRVSANDIVHLSRVPNAKTVQDFQEIVNGMRATAEIRRVFTYNAARMVAVRASPDEVAMADWVLKELDQPAGTGAAPEFRVPGAPDDVVRVYHLPGTETDTEFQTEVAAIRSGSGIRRVFTYNAPRAVAMRGTVNQLAVAEVLMRNVEGGRQH